MNWSAATTLKIPSNYGSIGNLRTIPEDESVLFRSPMQVPVRNNKLAEELFVSTKNGGNQLNTRAVISLCSVPALLFVFFLFIFILRANAPQQYWLWRDCDAEHWKHTGVCMTGKSLASRASIIVESLSWQEKLVQCCVDGNGIDRVSLSNFRYCKEGTFKQIVQVTNNLTVAQYHDSR